MENPSATLTVFSNCLVATLPQEAGIPVLEELRGSMLEALESANRRAVIFDLTGVQLLESSEFAHLSESGRMAELLGARACIAGLRPTVVAYLVSIEAEFQHFLIARSLQMALDQIEALQ